VEEEKGTKEYKEEKRYGSKTRCRQVKEEEKEEKKSK
jgi:hypothetical protein